MAERRNSRTLAAAAWLIATLVAAAAPAVAVSEWPGDNWRAMQLRTHPLVGVLWDARLARRASRNEMIARLRAASFRLIGEIHDNPDHHRIQAWLIAATHDAGRGAVVFEHIRADQVGALATFAALPDVEKTPARLLDLLVWEKSGWPPRALFEPLFAAVLSKGLAIVAGDAARDTVRSVARRGASSVSTSEQARLAFADDLPEAEASALLDELEASHCRLLPRTAFAGMALAQRFRDAHLARAMVDAAIGGPVTLVAGNGHVHAGRGVPWHLGRMAAGATIVTIALIEVSEGKFDAAAAAPADATGKPIADFVIFTPRVAREDPCVAMRRQFAPKPPSKP
ncbi:MAG: ChaN family lipoprotein [Hyphomicrobiaceae bacterium]